MIKKIGIKLALLLGVVALNIYPMGCWSGSNQTPIPIETPIPIPSPTKPAFYMIRKNNYLKALDCAKISPKNSLKDKEYLANKYKQVKDQKNDPLSETYSEMDMFRTKYPTCNFI